MRLVVVGAGIVGAACAFTATGLGADVVLVDAGLPGRATAAGAGIICPWTSGIADPDWYAFACAAAREYPALIEELSGLGHGDASYRKVGALYVAGPDRADTHSRSSQALDPMLELLRGRAETAPELGEPALLTAAQARRMFPPLREDAAAVRIPGAARVDGREITRAMTQAAIARGARLLTGRVRLAPVPLLGGDAPGVEVDGEPVAADAVVVAAGAWTAALLEPAGLTVRVRPERGQIAHIRMEGADTSHWPVVLPAGSGHYLLAFDDSRVVAGATRETGAGFGYQVTPGGLHEVLEQALSVAPGLATGTYLETRVGFRPAGPDALPLLGPVAGVPGLVVATGLGASGLTLGPRTGAIAARVVLGLAPGADLARFDPLR